MTSFKLPPAWASILEPIDPADPCGPDMRYSTSYEEIRQSRQSSNDNMPAGLWEREVKKPNWGDISRNCLSFLAKNSKDLQILAWMLEAFVMNRDLAGVAQTHVLINALCQRYWTDIHPRIEDDDVEMRLGPLAWVMRQEIQWFGRAGFWSQTAEAEAAGAQEHWRCIRDQMEALDQFLLEQLPDHAPSFSEFFEMLKQHIVLDDPASPEHGPAAAGATFGGSTRSRDGAYEQLKDIAQFLARAEPHSPVPMVLTALVQWRNATFEDLLNQLPSQGGSSVYDMLRLFQPPKL